MVRTQTPEYEVIPADEYHIRMFAKSFFEQAKTKEEIYKNYFSRERELSE